MWFDLELTQDRPNILQLWCIQIYSEEITFLPANHDAIVLQDSNSRGKLRFGDVMFSRTLVIDDSHFAFIHYYEHLGVIHVMELIWTWVIAGDLSDGYPSLWPEYSDLFLI